MLYSNTKGDYLMIDFIKKSIYIHKEQFLYFPLASVGMFVFGHIMLWLIMLLDNSSDLTSFELGTVMALMGLFFVALFCSMGYTNSFNYALSMSRKRSHIITALTIVSTIRVTLTIILIYVLNVIEQYVCKNAFAQYPMDSDLSVIFKPHIILTIVLAFVAIESLFGALYTRFGTKYFWIIWVAIVLLMQIPARLADKIAADDSHFFHKIIEFFINCNKTALFAALIGIMLLIISLPYKILKKQRVTI